jgi:O-antigen/teichoic acid export membrane protein
VADSRSNLATRTAATWLTLVATVVFTFVARALLAHVLGPVGIGIYALMLSAGWLGGTILSVGLPAYNASFAARQPPSVLLVNSILWNLLAFVVVTILCVPLLLARSVPAPAKGILVGVVMSPFTALLECTRGVLQGMGAIGAYNWLGLAAGAINFALIATLVAAGRLTLTGAVLCWIASTALSTMVAVLLAVPRTGRSLRGDRRIFAGSLKFGGQAWLSQLTGIVNFRIALLLSQVFLGTAAAGLYAIAVTIAETLFYFPNALAVVTISRYAAATPAQAVSLLKRSAALVVVVSAACAAAIAVAGGFVIAHVFGAAYTGSTGPLLILLPGVVSYTPIAVSNWYFNAHLHKPWVNLLVGLMSATVGSLLTVLWAPAHGLAGIAWATTTGYMTASVLNLVLIRLTLVRDGIGGIPREAA